MAEGKLIEEWNIAATHMVLFANANRTKGTRAYRITDFHPYANRIRKAARVHAVYDMDKLKKELGFS